MSVCDVPAGGRIAVVGGGTIGAGWAVVFAAAGYDTVVLDPDPAVAGRLAAMWETGLPVVHRVGIVADAVRPPVATTDPGPALSSAAFVQEAAPERLALKRDLLRTVETHLPPDVVIASSTSGLSASDIQAEMAHPGRLVVGHPFNPPYLMPVVEVGGGRLTDRAAIEAAAALYVSLGKTVLRLHKEAPGHIINRLQAALWREAVHLAVEGYASVGDIEKAVTEGLGPRWSVCGPTTIFHLAGGEGGMAKFLKDLGPEFERWWDDLGNPRLDERAAAILTEGIAEATGHRPVAEVAARRDRLVAERIAAWRTDDD